MGREVFDNLIEQIWVEWEYARHLDKQGPVPDTFEHHGAGTIMRNNLKLWWQPDWNEPKPAIVEFFNSLNIFHADDMSGAIQDAIAAKSRGEEFDLDKYVQDTLEFWKDQGFKDGIIK